MAFQWTSSAEISQGQTQSGYNYHHIDQRTEVPAVHSAWTDPKAEGLPDPADLSDVYAEFTTHSSQSKSEVKGHGQCDGRPGQQDVRLLRGDHAQYVTEQHLHFLPER